MGEGGGRSRPIHKIYRSFPVWAEINRGVDAAGRVHLPPTASGHSWANVDVFYCPQKARARESLHYRPVNHPPRTVYGE